MQTIVSNGKSLDQSNCVKTDLRKIMEFVHLAENLKVQLRNGILSDGKHESIADHCWRLSLLVVLCSSYFDREVDILKCIKMAIIHDVVEIYAGDTHFLKLLDPSAKKIQEKKEIEAMMKIRSSLPEDLGKELFDIWVEFEQESTYEARVVKALDKLEGYIQQNEADISTWTDQEMESVFYYLEDFCNFDSFLKLCKEFTISESIDKIKESDRAFDSSKFQEELTIPAGA